MRRTLVALLFTLGLSACGGIEEEGGLQNEQSPAEVQASTYYENCRVECWYPSSGTSAIRTSTYSACESYAMSFCNAAGGGNGGFWYNGQAYAW
ncbi:MAG TPA: hypothetical protein VK539_36995 [Myxococcaceae bacterium]|nr:hypothetical protein [Myxococcaceae bacterium]